MKSLSTISDLRGARVLVRGSLNVPVVQDEIVDSFRLDTTLKTLKYLHKQGARVLLIGHIADSGGDTLMPVYNYLKQHIAIQWGGDIDGYDMDLIEEGQIVLFENIRHHKGETENEDMFAQKLASYAEYYVNDAFAVSHRRHASIVGVPKYLPSVMGLQFEREHKELSRAFTPAQPALFIFGGVKFETKIPVAQKMLTRGETVFVGGALANVFFKAQGHHVGGSILPRKLYDVKNDLTNPQLLLPQDVCGKGFCKIPEELHDTDVIRDAGPQTIEFLREKVNQSAFVLWNGPLGDYEHGFYEHNEKLAHIIAECDAISIVGGGDTIASIGKLGLEDKFTFVSTAGGAMLAYLADETLPGIEALR